MKEITLVFLVFLCVFLLGFNKSVAAQESNSFETAYLDLKQAQSFEQAIRALDYFQIAGNGEQRFEKNLVSEFVRYVGRARLANLPPHSTAAILRALEITPEQLRQSLQRARESGFGAVWRSYGVPYLVTTSIVAGAIFLIVTVPSLMAGYEYGNTDPNTWRDVALVNLMYHSIGPVVTSALFGWMAVEMLSESKANRRPNFFGMNKKCIQALLSSFKPKRLAQ